LPPSFRVRNTVPEHVKASVKASIGHSKTLNWHQTTDADSVDAREWASTRQKIGGSAWESNPPGNASVRPHNGFEDRAPHQRRRTPIPILPEFTEYDNFWADTPPSQDRRRPSVAGPGTFPNILVHLSRTHRFVEILPRSRWPDSRSRPGDRATMKLVISLCPSGHALSGTLRRSCQPRGAHGGT
jgi:hypothetical protein